MVADTATKETFLCKKGNLRVDEIRILVKEDMRRGVKRGPLVVRRSGAEGAFSVLPVVVILVHGRHLLRMREEGISRAGNGVSRGAMGWGEQGRCVW
jgi:hypothetical protein